MKTKPETVHIPLPNRSMTFELDPPCAFCGQPVGDEKPRVFEEKYLLMRWIRSRKTGQFELSPLRDRRGETLQGKVVLRIPYCPEHQSIPKAVNVARAIAIGTGILVTIATWLICLASFSLPAKPDGQFIQIFGIAAISVVVGIIVAGLAWRIATLFSPAVGQFRSLTANAWGLSLSVLRDTGPRGVGPITYTLSVQFDNPEAACRLRESWPQAK